MINNMTMTLMKQVYIAIKYNNDIKKYRFNNKQYNNDINEIGLNNNKNLTMTLVITICSRH